MKRTPTLSRALPLVAFLLTSSFLLAAEDLRLGTNVVPVTQSIRLELDADRTDYSGSVSVEIQVKKATKSFRFHAEEMDLTSIVLNGPSGSIDLTHEKGKLGLVTVTAADPIQPGDYTLAIDFANDFGTKAVGLYRVEQDGRGYAFTQFEAEDGREAFPLWDEPAFKIPYQMTITVPEDHIAVTNTPVKSETVSDGKRTFVFAQTRPLPSYLLAIATGPLETRPIPNLPVDGRIVTVKGKGDLTELAAMMTPPLLEAMEGYFGSQYPYEKLDIIAIPDYWPGAMENPGAITFAEPILLVDSDTATVAERKRLSRVMAHELAHMWFGDLVTMKWWDDLWLNESFADWMGDKISEKVHPQFKLGLSELLSIQNTMAADARPSAQAIRRPVEPGANMLENLGTAYNKGKTVLGMFERWIGPESFRKGVIEYIEANKWGNAAASDLWAKLSKASKNDVSAAMKTFVEQSGLPIVRIEPVGDGRVKISQRRYLNHGVEGESRLWKIPVTFKYSDGTSVRSSTVLLESAAQTVTLRADDTIDWIMPDANARGYYRWNLPAGMMSSLAEKSSERLTPRERIGTLGNLSSLLAAGLIRGDQYLTMLAHFADDEEPLVITALLEGLEGVKMAFVPEDLEDSFALYVRRMLAPALERFGMEAKPGEHESVSLLRPALMAWMGDTGRDAATLEHAEAMARSYMKDPSSVDPALAGVVLRLAAIRGDRQLFDVYRKRFEATESPADRERYLAAMGYFRDPALIEEALRYSLTGPLRHQEIFELSSGLQETADGRERRFKYVTENYDAIKERVPEVIMAFMPYLASGCEAERLDAARRFFSQPGHDVPGTSTSMAKVADQVTDCAALRAREADTVRAYLGKLTMAGGGPEAVSH